MCKFIQCRVVMQAAQKASGHKLVLAHDFPAVKLFSRPPATSEHKSNAVAIACGAAIAVLVLACALAAAIAFAMRKRRSQARPASEEKMQAPANADLVCDSKSGDSLAQPLPPRVPYMTSQSATTASEHRDESFESARAASALRSSSMQSAASAHGSSSSSSTLNRPRLAPSQSPANTAMPPAAGPNGSAMQSSQLRGSNTLEAVSTLSASTPGVLESSRETVRTSKPALPLAGGSTALPSGMSPLTSTMQMAAGPSFGGNSQSSGAGGNVPSPQAAAGSFAASRTPSRPQVQTLASSHSAGDPTLRRIEQLQPGMTSVLGSRTFTVQLPATSAAATGLRHVIAAALSNLAHARPQQLFAGRYLVQVCRSFKASCTQAFWNLVMFMNRLPSLTAAWRNKQKVCRMSKSMEDKLWFRWLAIQRVAWFNMPSSTRCPVSVSTLSHACATSHAQRHYCAVRSMSSQMCSMCRLW